MSDKLNDLMDSLAPILDGLETGQDCADFAYAKSNNFQAMTYCPEAFEALKELPVAVSALQDEVELLRNRWAMIDKLRDEEGHSVELIHDNPDFGGPNCVVHVSIDYSQNHDAYYGDTIDDCLQKAVAALEARNDQSD